MSGSASIADPGMKCDDSQRPEKYMELTHTILALDTGFAGRATLSLAFFVMLTYLLSSLLLQQATAAESYAAAATLTAPSGRSFGQNTHIKALQTSDACCDGNILTKNDFRRDLLSRRKAMNQSDVTLKSSMVCRRIIGTPEFSAAATVALYASFMNEVVLEEIMPECEKLGKQVLLPRFNRVDSVYEMVSVMAWAQDCILGHHGILEPADHCRAVPAESLCSQSLLWLIPGVGFDLNGTRLGFGKGYYDRLLAHAAGCRIGICYDFQIVSRLPVAANDVSMNIIVTERRICRIGDQA